jgi:hypothetical protein
MLLILLPKIYSLDKTHVYSLNIFVWIDLKPGWKKNFFLPQGEVKDVVEGRVKNFAEIFYRGPYHDFRVWEYVSMRTFQYEVKNWVDTKGLFEIVLITYALFKLDYSEQSSSERFLLKGI